MANRILVYQDGQRLGIEGVSTGQVLAWNDATGAWELSSTGSGTVTSVTAGTGLTGGVITASGTIAADFGTGAGKIAEGNDIRFPPAPSAAGRIVYDTGTAWVALAAGSAGQVLQSNGAGAPSWAAAATGTVTSITAGTGLSGGTITGSGTIALASTGVTTGDYGTTAAKTASFSVNAQGQLTAASEQDIAIAASQVTSGTFSVARGGTGVSTITAGGILLGAGAAPITTKTLGAGELLIGSAVSGPDAATLTAGTGVSITNGNHSISIDIGQAVGTANSPTFVGATFSGLTANRFVYTNASKALTSLANGVGTLAGYDTSGDATAITLGTGLSMTGSVLSAAGTGGTVTSVTLDLGTTGLKLAGNNTTQTITTSGTFTISGTLGVANGGTGAATLTQYAVLLGNGTSEVATAAPATAGHVLTSNGASANPSFQAIPYDIAGMAPGTLTANAEVWYFVATRACTIPTAAGVSTVHRGRARTAPSGGSVAFSIKNSSGTEVGTMDFASGASTATFTISSAISLAEGDWLYMVAPANVYSIANVFFTLRATLT